MLALTPKHFGAGIPCECGKLGRNSALPDPGLTFNNKNPAPPARASRFKSPTKRLKLPSPPHKAGIATWMAMGVFAYHLWRAFAPVAQNKAKP
jgi:hypothetical protein